MPVCDGSLFQPADQSHFTFANNTQVYTGRLEVCLDGVYVPVCSSALNYNELDNVCGSAFSNGKPFIGS